MAREIRITIDDDEIFERMKGRKRELDLSWEEVLHRGLRREGDGASDPRRGPAPRGRSPPDPVSSPGAFAEDLKRQIQGQVRDSLRGSLGADEWEAESGPAGAADEAYADTYADDPQGHDPLEDDVESLTSAEDAVLCFDFLGEAGRDPAAKVPLRVILEAGADGLDVDVVAVRKGKTVTEMNGFERQVRRRIAEGLAAGEPATLRLEAGVEEYPVSPRLTWSRGDDGGPIVADVTIEEVRFDDD